MLERITRFLFENQTTKQTVVKNTFWLFFGQILGRLFRAALVIAAARILGPTSWGAFSYVVGLIAFLQIFADLGLNAIVTRESAKDPSQSRRYFATAFFIKIVLLGLSSAFLMIGAPYLTT